MNNMDMDIDNGTLDNYCDKNTPLFLVSSEGVGFELDRGLLKKSTVLTDLVSGDPNETEIRFPKFDSKTLEKIVVFLRRDVDYEVISRVRKPIIETDINKILPEWEVNFVNVPCELLMAMMNGADYFNINSMVELCAIKLAITIKDLTMMDMKTLFNSGASINAQETDKIRTENAWICCNN